MVKARSAVFVDAGIEAPSVLLAGIALEADVSILSPTEDGIEQITSSLASHPELSDVHIIAHGQPGSLRLGTAQLNLQTLHRYQRQLRQWFGATELATLSLYGCNVAAGDAGGEFLAKLQSLTGASIAASPRLVGHASRGGDWRLDTILGSVPARSPFTAAAIASYPGILNEDNFENATVLTDTGSGSNVGATHQTGEPIHDPTVSNLSFANQADLNDSIWWQWTAGETGDVTVSTAGSSLNTVLAVYTGSTVNSLTLVGANDDSSPGVSSSSVTFVGSAGTTYFLAVDGVGSAQGDVSIAIDTAPEITPGQSFTVAEDAIAGASIGTVQVNEADLTFTITGGNPDNDGDGTSAFNIGATGEITVADVDDLDFEAFDSFYTLQVTVDDGGFTDVESVFVEVTDAPDDPLLVSLTPSQTTADEGSLITLSGQILDPDRGENQTVTIEWGDGTTTVVNGDDLVTLDAAGNKTFDRNHVYQDNGQFTINVTVDDGGGNPVSDTRTITVNNVAPTITQGETFELQLDEDDPASIFQLLATEPSQDDTLTWSIVGPAVNGAASVSASPNGQNQIITYTPEANFSGTDSFQVQVADDDGGTDAITVNVDVAAQPDTPANLTLSTSDDTLDEGETITLTGSFTDPDEGDTFTVTINWGDGSAATVLTEADITANGNGTFSFTADHAYVADTDGTATGITVSVQDSFNAIASASTPVTVNNVAPTIEPGPNTSISIQEDEEGTLTLTAIDPADTTFNWAIATDGTNGTATVSPNPTGETQAITYTPNLNFSGIDEFVVAVDDGDGGTNTVTVVVGVDPVNDDPENLQITPSITDPIDEGTAFTLDGSFEDVDLNDTHTVTIAWGDESVVVLQDDELTDDGAGNISFAGIAHTYADEGTGTYTIEVTATDAEGVSISTTEDVTVNNVAPVITDPDGADDGATTLPSIEEDSSTDFTLTATDVGTADSLTWSILTQGSNGTVELDDAGPDGAQSFTYTPNGNFGGPDDAFTLQVSDGDGGLDTIDVTVPITPSNDPPEIIANEFDIVEGAELRIDTNVLDAFDLETTDDSQIVFTITGLAEGDSFFVGDTAQNTFTRADILASTVTFVGNGDEIEPSFSITVEDAEGGSATAIANIASFTTVNDAPVFNDTNVPFPVTEGSVVPVRASNISATDEESDPQTLTFTVSNLVAGTFLVNDDPSDTFTLQQINQNAVRFRHDDSETPPTYTVTVSDGELSATRDDVPIFTNANDPPEIISNAFDIVEDESLRVTTSVLDAVDLETTDDSLIVFSITGLTAGNAFAVDGVVQDTFTRADILAGDVTFAGNGDGFTITVEDADGGEISAAANIDSFTDINDGPVFNDTNVPFTVFEGDSVAVRAANISATDEETDDQDLTFTISNLVGGEFLVNNDPSDTFTLQQINQNAVRFEQDGSETPPTYTVTVSDGELSASRDDTPIFNSQNDAPEIITNEFNLTEGDPLLVNTGVLDAIDVETTDDNLIVFTIAGLADGDAFTVGDTVQNTFTRADILAGDVSFVGSGESFTITVADESGEDTSVAANIASFIEVNDAPVFDDTNVPFIVTEGGPVAVRATNISATDEETDDQELTFTISNLVGGEFLVNGDPSDTFTLQQINQNTVRFSHDGSETPPSYRVTVSDGELSESRDDTPVFNTINDPPTFLNNGFDLEEGELVPITPASLNATDVETLDNNLVFSISDLAGGSFLFNDTPFDIATETFTLEDVILGNVAFQHDDSEDEPTYTVTVTDDGTAEGGAPESTDQLATIAFERRNDNPTILANSFAIAEGGTLVITTALIDTEDEVGETSQSELVFTVSDLAGGFFALGTANTEPISTFTRQDIDLRRIIFVQDGTNTTPSYTLTVEDTEGGTATSESEVTLQGINDAPEIITNVMAIAEGETFTFTSSDLSATDEESAPNELTYTLTAFTNGTFQLDETPLDVGDTFTQQDVIDGLVTFVHDDSNTAPTYTLTLTDTPVGELPANTTAPNDGDVTFAADNDAPVITALAFTIREGEAVPITTTQLSATDEETANPALLVYTVDSVSNGSFQLDGEATNEFTQQDIINGDITFVHDDSESAPSYTVTVNDGGTPEPQEASATVDLDFINANDPPTLLVNELEISEGATVTFSTDILSATDLETADPSLVFDISGITNGTFIVNGATFNDTAQFTLLDIIEGRVSFEHDGTNNEPTYEVTVSDDSDPAGITGPETVAVENFEPENDDPTILVNAFTVNEGGLVVLGTGAIDAEDVEGETPRAELQYTVSDLAGGRFARSSATSTAITTFSQNDLDQGRIVFVHDGSNTVPSYTLTVEDSDGGTATSESNVTLLDGNDAPSIITNTLAIAEGATVDLTTANLAATDEESTPAELTYTVVSVTNGRFEFNETTVDAGSIFTQQDVLDGLVTFIHDGTSTAPTYTLTLTDTAVGSSEAITTEPNEGLVAFTATNDEPTVTANSFTIQESQAFPITTNELSVTDEETTDASQLVYTVDSTSNGSFQLNGVDADSFTQQDILNNSLTFVHDGSESAPSYALTVSDNGTPEPSEVEVAIDLDFTNLNDAPELLVNSLTIGEGATVTLSTDNLSASDLETIAPQLVFDISGITGGQFIVNGTPFDTTAQFSLADIIRQTVQFEQDGTETIPTYEATVTDGGTATGAPITTEPDTVDAVLEDDNDNPTILNNSFAINEGEILILDESSIDSEDEPGETPRLDLEYTVADVVGGRFARSTATSEAIDAFSQQDVDRGLVVFVHDGSNTTPTYTLTVTDEEGGATTGEGDVTLAPTNDGPSITTNQLTLEEDETATLSPDDLQATDEESTAGQLTYNATNVTGGVFQLSGTDTTTFTQQNVNSGIVTFVQDGTNETPTYILTVTDTAVGDSPAITSEPSEAVIDFTATNDAPELAIAFPEVNEGGTVELTTAILSATDEESDTTQLAYTVDEANSGEFQVDGDAITTFTQADIDAGLVNFVHDGSESGPSFTLTLTDNGTPEPATLTETVTPAFISQNTPPQFTANQISPEEDRIITLTTANLAAEDDEDAPGQLRFSIVSVTGGTFLLNGRPLDSTDTFRRADIAFELVTFEDDGDEVPPEYVVAVTDSDGETTQAAGTITEFISTNDLPTLTVNTFNIVEGDILTLDSGNLLAEDGETTNLADLTYTVDNVTSGGFFDDAANPITTFTQQDINNGQVVFRHNGSEVAPTFDLTLTDSDSGSISVEGFINEFTETNDFPVATDDGGAGFSTTEDTVLITPDLTVNDTDGEGDPLNVISIAGNAIAPGETITLDSGALVTLNDDGTNAITYDPNDAFEELSQGQSATETFAYAVSDGEDTAVAEVAIEVLGVNEPAPVFFDYEQFLRAEDVNATAPSIEIGGLPLAQLFDENFYLNQNPDVAAAVANGRFASGFDHFVGFGIDEGRAPSILYDEEFYLDGNEDVAAAVDAGRFASGLDHFLTVGHIEQREPSSEFSQADYLAGNTDVSTAVADERFGSGFEHYVEFGAGENRDPRLALYDEAFYLQNNPDVDAAVNAGRFIDGFDHFITIGQTEERRPSQIFSEVSYLDLNSDVDAAVADGRFTSGFEHYEQLGRFEERPVFG